MAEIFLRSLSSYFRLAVVDSESGNLVRIQNISKATSTTGWFEENNSNTIGIYQKEKQLLILLDGKSYIIFPRKEIYFKINIYENYFEFYQENEVKMRGNISDWQEKEFEDDLTAFADSEDQNIIFLIYNILSEENRIMEFIEGNL